LSVLLVKARRRALAWKTAAPLVLAALLLVLFAGRSRWTVLNACMPRYIYMAMLSLQTGLIVALIVSLAGWMGKRDRRLGAWAAAASVLAAVGVTYGQPSLAVVRTCLDERLGGATSEILQAGCTHVAGDYWRVWPTVFHANLQLRDQGETRTVWGVAYRSLPTLPQWAPRADKECRVAILGRDDHADDLLDKYFPSLGSNSVTWQQSGIDGRSSCFTIPRPGAGMTRP